MTQGANSIHSLALLLPSACPGCCSVSPQGLVLLELGSVLWHRMHAAPKAGLCAAPLSAARIPFPSCLAKYGSWLTAINRKREMDFSLTSGFAINTLRGRREQCRAGYRCFVLLLPPGAVAEPDANPSPPIISHYWPQTLLLIIHLTVRPS